jgi:hypothetical protein
VQETDVDALSVVNKNIAQLACLHEKNNKETAAYFICILDGF